MKKNILLATVILLSGIALTACTSVDDDAPGVKMRGIEIKKLKGWWIRDDYAKENETPGIQNSKFTYQGLYISEDKLPGEENDSSCGMVILWQTTDKDSVVTTTDICGILTDEKDFLITRVLSPFYGQANELYYTDDDRVVIKKYRYKAVENVNDVYEIDGYEHIAYRKMMASYNPYIKLGTDEKGHSVLKRADKIAEYEWEIHNKRVWPQTLLGKWLLKGYEKDGAWTEGETKKAGEKQLSVRFCADGTVDIWSGNSLNANYYCGENNIIYIRRVGGTKLSITGYDGFFDEYIRCVYMYDQSYLKNSLKLFFSDADYLYFDYQVDNTELTATPWICCGGGNTGSTETDTSLSSDIPLTFYADGSYQYRNEKHRNEGCYRTDGSSLRIISMGGDKDRTPFKDCLEKVKAYQIVNHQLRLYYGEKEYLLFNPIMAVEKQ